MKSIQVHPLSILAGCMVTAGIFTLTSMQGSQFIHGDVREFLNHISMVDLPDGQGEVNRTVRISGQYVAFQEHEVRVQGGESTTLRVTPQPGTHRRLVLEPRGEEDVEIRVLDESGSAFHGHIDVSTQHVSIHGLTPGLWRVLASTGGTHGATSL